jgi:HSP20 family protein
MANSIVRWEPFREAVSLRDAIDRLFEESMVRPGSFFAPALEGPAVDMYQTKDDVIVKATIPGVKPEDVDISITGDVLTIKGEFKEDEKIEKDQYIYQERRAGQFCRQVSLPVSVKTDKAQAEFEHGVLTLRLPKAEAAKPKSIKVKVK